MQIALSEAKAKLTALVRRVEDGESIVLTRNGKPVARIVPEKHWRDKSREERRQVLEEIMNKSRALGLHLGKSGAELQKEINDDVEASWERS